MSQNTLLSSNFSMTNDQIHETLNDKTPRAYTDYFEDAEEGKKYKGEWNMDHQQHGLGI
jgi:hypothetical protein